MAKPTKNDQYLNFKQARETAAYLERNGFYEKAADEWIFAGKIAVTKEDRIWCINKGAFCQHQFELKKAKEEETKKL